MNIIYRLCESTISFRGSNFRPYWFSKVACLNSFLHAAKFAQNKIDNMIFVHDGPKGVLHELLSDYTVEKINYNNNGQSLMTTFNIANSLDGDVYFVEDDYLHQENSIVKTATALNRYKLVSGYDHLDRYTRTDDISYVKKVDWDPVGEHHWRTAEAICGTFAASRETWHRIKYQAVRYFPLEDREFFRQLHTNDIPLWTAIPGLIQQVDPNIFPVKQWQELNNKFIET